MLNHQRKPGVAPGPTTSPPRRALQVVAALHARVATLAARLRRSTSSLDSSDRQFLRDLERDDVRYPMRAIVRLAGIAAQSEQPHHREALPQAVRELIVAQRAAVIVGELLDVDAAFDGETDAQAEFDKAQRRYDHAPTPENHSHAIEMGQRQLVWTQASLDSLYAAAPRRS